ncbi:uncharacterized protein LOC129794716 [Lutzomyia longipalpis]|uniref:uncharacterized protein LOC129794716 n=1 Tax=Lutzomyia longipalpis TaxID=7200 RepID=UPI0024839AAE|nr:uncharacterized protein LOC129794716 [Lutzomyia longipalpis]
MALGRNLLLFIPFWVLLSTSSVKCKEVCLSPSMDAKENDSNCVVRGFSLNSKEMLRVKTLFLGTFCNREQAYHNFFVSSESSSDLNLYDNSYNFHLDCSQMFDSFSGLFYWAPMAYARKYFELLSYFYIELIVKDANGTEPNIDLKTIHSYYSIRDAGLEESYLMILREPSLYDIRSIEKISEKKSPQEIVDLGTFSFYNPTEDFQEIKFQVNVTDNMILTIEDFFLYDGTRLVVTENEKIWNGNISYDLWDSRNIELQRNHLMEIALSSALPPKTSISGRIFATIILTRTQFMGTLDINGGNETENLATMISGEMQKYEKTNIRLENIKMSPHEQKILFASYVACFVGLLTAVIMGFAVFLICLVAQKKNKECICSCPRMEFDLEPKRQFIAEKGQKIGQVLAEFGNVCGNICSCICTEITPKRESFTPRA